MVNEASTSGGKTVVAKVSKVPDKLRPYIPEELDMLVIISEDEWLRFGVEGRKAIIDHELCHIVFSSSGGFTTKAHDIEEFQEIIERYGYWNSDLRNARDAFISATQLKLPVTDNNPKGVLVQVKSFGLADR